MMESAYTADVKRQSLQILLRLANADGRIRLQRGRHNNAETLSNRKTPSFCRISYNDMTYIGPEATALMHCRGKRGPADLKTALIIPALMLVRAHGSPDTDIDFSVSWSLVF